MTYLERLLMEHPEHEHDYYRLCPHDFGWDSSPYCPADIHASDNNPRGGCESHWHMEIPEAGL
jgi:hypothetical protein